MEKDEKINELTIENYKSNNSLKRFKNKKLVTLILIIFISASIAILILLIYLININSIKQNSITNNKNFVESNYEDNDYIERKNSYIYALENGIFKKTDAPIDIYEIVFDGSGNIYYIDDATINDSEASENIIYSYNLYEDKITEIYKVNNGNISNLVYDNQNLYFSYSDDENITGAGDYEVQELNLSSKNLRTIGEITTEIWTGVRFVGKKNNYGVLRTTGGDGCAGWGEILVLQNGIEKSVTETGGGCNFSPHFIHFNSDNDSVILAEVSERPEELQGEGFDNYYFFENLYFQNVLTGQVETIYDLSNEKEDILSIHYDKKTNAIWIIKKDEMILINPDSKIAKIINYPDGIASFVNQSSWIDYGYLNIINEFNEDENKINGYSLDLISGELTLIEEIERFEDTFYNENYIGNYNGVRYYSHYE